MNGCVQFVSIVKFFRSVNSGCLNICCVSLCQSIGSPPVIIKCMSEPLSFVHLLLGVYSFTFCAISSTVSQATRCLYLLAQLALASQPISTTGKSLTCLTCDKSCVIYGISSGFNHLLLSLPCPKP